jgi:acyl-CoA synthetase (AMP-forming)/AMP-acid ligase II
MGIARLNPSTFTATDEATTYVAGLDDVALIMMTSGTTSEPKGVMLTHRALQARLALNVAYMGTRDLHVGLTVLPMHFGHGLIGNTLTLLAAGGTLAVWPEPGPAGLPMLGQVIDRHEVTFMSSVPSLWRAALRLSPPPRLGTMRRVHIGSAPLSAELWHQVSTWAGTKRVLNMYGITETANWIGGHSAEDGVLDDGLVGLPWGGSIVLHGDQGARIHHGRGEVLVNSPSLMSGYLDREDLTQASLAGDWFLTGDIGEIDEQGRLRIVGRSKHEINRGGIKIPAEEIDRLLERHPDVVEACGFALPDPLSGETVAAAVVLEPGSSTTIETLRQWCAGEIRREASPSRLFVLPALPRTDRGKLNRDVVRAACVGSEPGEAGR